MTTDTIAERVRYRLERETTAIPRNENPAGDCEICGRTILPVTEVHVCPVVCTCSDETRPTLADPCREWEVPAFCAECLSEVAA